MAIPISSLGVYPFLTSKSCGNLVSNGRVSGRGPIASSSMLENCFQCPLFLGKNAYRSGIVAKSATT